MTTTLINHLKGYIQIQKALDESYRKFAVCFNTVGEKKEKKTLHTTCTIRWGQ